MAMLQDPMLGAYLKPRPSRRSRPSLAALADSGYEPSRPPSLRSTVPRFFAQNQNVNLTLDTAQLQRENSDPFDLGVASQLLGDDSLLRDPFVSQRARPAQSATMRSLRTLPFSFSLDGESGTVKQSKNNNTRPPSASVSRAGTFSRSRSGTVSSAWSGVTNRLFTESAVGAANEHVANGFTEQFDKLAKKHGIQPFPDDYKGEPTSVSVSSASPQDSSGENTPRNLPGNKLWNKLLRRTPSTVDISRQHGNAKMTLTKKRTISISDLTAIGRGKRDSLKGMHLEDMIRLGGVAVFTLPLGLAPGDLLIPTCIHAAATFILNNALKAPGLFRVSGNVNTTFALYDYYQRQLEENNNESVVATTALARLPAHIHYTVHDVASLLKKLLIGLPGGLLGSPAVFQALYNIHTFVYPDPTSSDRASTTVKPRMIALALASINLHFRIALICAVMGLLRTVSLAADTETDSKVKDPAQRFVEMKEDALGIVFGPLLLGDKSEHILTDELSERGGLLVLPKIDPAASFRAKGTGRFRSNSKLDPQYNKRQLERTRRAAMVCQMLIDHWEDICYQLKRINALGVTAQAYDLPGQTQADGFNFVQEGEARPLQDPPSTGTQRLGTARSRRSSVKEDKDKERHHHSLHLGHSIGKHFTHLPHHGSQKGSQKGKRPELDLMDFERGAGNDMHLTTPLQSDTYGRGRGLMEMTPVPELTTPRETPLQSPAWPPPPPPPPIPPDSPLREPQSGMSTPNWRTAGNQTPGKDSFAGTPNWRPTDLDLDKIGLESMMSTPNWRLPEPEKSPGKESMATPNWRVADPEKTPVKQSFMPMQDPDKTPGKESMMTMMSTPNWRMMPELPTPVVERNDDSPNWRVLDPREMNEPPETPTKPKAPTDVNVRPLSRASTATPASLYPHSSGTSSGASTPPLEVQAEAALRYIRHPPTPPSIDDVIVEGDTSLSAPDELESSALQQRTISPIPELTYALRNIVSDPEDMERPRTARGGTGTITRKDRRPPPPSFSIFRDDDPEATPRGTVRERKAQSPPQVHSPPHGPALTLTKPNSNNSIRLNQKVTAPPPLWHLPESPSRGVPLQPATPNRRPRAGTLDSDFEDRYAFRDTEDSPGKKGRANSALHAEIRRLQRLLDVKTEEANQTRKELELAKNMVQAGTISHLLREAQEETKVWRNRAQWAEKQLRAQHATQEQRQLPEKPTVSSLRIHRRNHSAD